jgi:hypothetical protein
MPISHNSTPRMVLDSVYGVFYRLITPEANNARSGRGFQRLDYVATAPPRVASSSNAAASSALV